MRDAESVPETSTKMFDMSIQEVNGKGPKKRKKSLEHICDNESQSLLNVAEKEKDVEVKNAGPKVTGCDGVELLHWKDMPQHLQFNPYVLTGYRPLQSWSGCVRSLFYFHNETINILTHGKFDSILNLLAVTQHQLI
ncbi:jg27948 [Pararge aegeria aegeria]|uniref:Jg27948 protein n=1 Tax=Pararge aegeria aegeria TaxID=348720 RepID=A0A8S4QTK5_9NEOP|nr:jg27948 [Pararge aegeria aegeria]